MAVQLKSQQVACPELQAIAIVSESKILNRMVSPRLTTTQLWCAWVVCQQIQL